ncbi:MAG: hypothetical protein D6696_16880 [Acidobacteria bacterium]|nr:MAG: hypothetical protein D6696_16880 [Acidobacteriota bacterium]
MKKRKRRKLQLSRETLHNLVHGTGQQAIGKETVWPQCLSQSIDPPTCCITCPSVACDCASDPCPVPRDRA